MNTDKLLEAIQILVKEEVKSQLPKLVSDALKSKKTSGLNESRLKTKNSKAQSIRKAILGEDYVHDGDTTTHYSKNPMLNQILNETRNNSSYPGVSGGGYEEWPTMKNPLTSVNPSTDIESIRASMAEKIGYGDMNSGLNVNTGNVALDKALNRDYTELVKRFVK